MQKKNSGPAYTQKHNDTHSMEQKKNAKIIQQAPLICTQIFVILSCLYCIFCLTFLSQLTKATFLFVHQNQLYLPRELVCIIRQCIFFRFTVYFLLLLYYTLYLFFCWIYFVWCNKVEKKSLYYILHFFSLLLYARQCTCLCTLTWTLYKYYHKIAFCVPR